MSAAPRVLRLARPPVHAVALAPALAAGTAAFRSAAVAASRGRHPSGRLFVVRTEGLDVLVPMTTSVAARHLGTQFGPVAASVADRLVRAAPDLLGRRRRVTWAAAVVFWLAELGGFFQAGRALTRTGLAAELGTTLPTMRRAVRDLATVLDPATVEIPVEPD